MIFSELIGSFFKHSSPAFQNNDTNVVARHAAPALFRRREGRLASRPPDMDGINIGNFKKQYIRGEPCDSLYQQTYCI